MCLPFHCILLLLLLLLINQPDQMSPTVSLVSEWFIKPSSSKENTTDEEEPIIIHLTPFELVYLNLNYSQKGLLFAKPPKKESFSISAFLDDLRRSLSDTLTHFHPLAGRLATRKQPNSYVIYLDPENSPGVKFVYATSLVSVSDILSPNDVTLFHPFFDLNHAINHDGHTLPLLSVQVTELLDGVFIGGSINHVVADGTSFWRFMHSWNQTYNNNHINTNENASCFIRTSIKGCDPVINLPYTHHHEFIERIIPQKVVLMEKFFHFSSCSISKLKAKANAELAQESQKMISSLQAVSALLWRCITRARRLPQDAETVCKLATSNRRRLNPPLPDEYFGNPVNLVKGTATVADLINKKSLGWAALQLNEAIKKHDDKSVKEWIHSWTKSPSIVKLSGMFDERSNAVTIGSSPRFDMYACQFGLGKPVATRSGCANKADGKITLFPGRDGAGSMGVEICLVPQYMKDLECDQEFITTAQK